MYWTQALDKCMSCEMLTPYACEAGIFLFQSKWYVCKVRIGWVPADLHFLVGISDIILLLLA